MNRARVQKRGTDVSDDSLAGESDKKIGGLG
jgi:hypothetical protein